MENKYPIPTKDDFLSLYQEKGVSPIIWYIWRCNLRKLPILGAYSWPEHQLKSCTSQLYHLFQPCMVWSQWLTSQQMPELCIEASLKALEDKVKKNGDYKNYFFAEEMVTTTIDSVQCYRGGLDIMEGKVSPLSVHILTDRAYLAAEQFHSDRSVRTDRARKEAAVDDFSILHNTEVFDQKFWFSKPLWKENIISSCEPIIYIKYRKKLLHELSKFGYDFLYEDFKSLLEMKPLRGHAKNYLKDISETDLNNPEALRRIILGGEAEKIYAVRTLLLGPGGAGKSSLADRLQGKPVEQTKTATQGIEYQNHQPLDLKKTFPKSNIEEKDLSLYLWDFGGQIIFHGLHRAFLHENCVYILVVDSRHEQVPDEWLHQIRHLVGGDTTVLLVTNQHDGCDIRQNETRLLREFPDLLDNNSFHYFSCIDSKSSELTIFVNELTKAALDSQKAVWKETLNIYQAIREYTKQRSAVFISMTQIKKIISDNGRVENSKAMINSLEQLGFLASITKGKLSYCLKPEWAVDRAYELLYSDTLRDNKGKLDLLDFDECFTTALTEEQQSKLLDFLDHRSLCFELPESGEYFFPDAATADEPETVADLLKQKQRLQIRFDLPNLPLGFHTRLVKPLFNQEAGITDSQNIWRQGFITQHAESYAVVQYLFRKSSIEVTLVGNPEYYATLLDKFYTVLSSAVAENKTRLQSYGIRPFVFLEKGLFELDRAEEPQAFSVHSVVELVNVLQAANGDLKQVYEDVRDMAADKKDETHHHYHDKVFNTDISGDGQNAVGSDNATMNQYIDKSHTEITADQRHQVATIVGELLKDAGSLPTEQLIAVTETKKALEAPVDDAVSQNLLGQVVSSIDGVATFTKDKALPIAEFAIKHKEALGAALAAAKTACNL